MTACVEWGTHLCGVVCSEVCKDREGECLAPGEALLDCKATLSVHQAEDIHVRLHLLLIVAACKHVNSVTHCAVQCRPGIALDYHLRPVIDNVESDLHVPGHSLNGVARKHEQERIVIDNQHILQRICNSKGAYSGTVNCTTPVLGCGGHAGVWRSSCLHALTQKCNIIPIISRLSRPRHTFHKTTEVNHSCTWTLCTPHPHAVPLTVMPPCAARRWQQEGQQQKKYAEIRRRVMPEGSRPGTGQSAHRLNSKSSPELIYRTSGRPATAATGTRSGYSPRSALAESSMSTAHAAGRPMTAA